MTTSSALVTGLSSALPETSESRAGGIQLTLVRSRVGRRVAALLVLTGLLPLLALAAVTGWMLSSYLTGREEASQRAMAKASAMASLDRLLDVEERVRGIAGEPTAVAPPASIRGVTSLLRLDRQGGASAIFGRFDPPALDKGARDRLADGRAALVVQPHGPLLLVVPAHGAGLHDSIGLVAALDPRALWQFDDRPADGHPAREVCAAAGGVELGCADAGRRLDLSKVLRGTAGSGPFTATFGEDEMIGAYWSAPVQAQFGIPDWTAIVVTRRADALAPARRLTRTVALVAVATICAVLLLSLHQVRRLLDPIARLQEGTARLARGEFATRVEVRTGDELQELGDAFNRMAGDLQSQFGQLRALSVGTLEALARAIDAKSAWTAGHSTRVAEVSVAIARGLGLSAAAEQRIYQGAMLHDIGKIGISADILDKVGPLTAAEAAIVAQHPEMGERILEPLPHCADILPMVRQHHERIDGSGYPDGLTGDAIAFDARVLAVADSYDALTSDRPYRRGMPPRDAVATLAAGAGTLFDAAVIEAFVDAFRRGRIPASPTLDERRDRTA